MGRALFVLNVVFAVLNFGMVVLGTPLWPLNLTVGIVNTVCAYAMWNNRDLW